MGKITVGRKSEERGSVQRTRTRFIIRRFRGRVPDENPPLFYLVWFYHPICVCYRRLSSLPDRILRRVLYFSNRPVVSDQMISDSLSPLPDVWKKTHTTRVTWVSELSLTSYL